MSKYVTIGALITAAVCLIGLWYALNQALAAREQIGWNKAVNAQQETDIAHATAQMERQNKYYERALAMGNTLGGIKDETETGPRLGVALDNSLFPPPPPRNPRK